jgi:hypothetical protein
MTKRSTKKPDKQLDLPTPAAATASRVLPMQLRVSDRLTDETGEWDVIDRPYTTAAGKNVHVRVQRAGRPDVIETRTWAAHQRVLVKRGGSAEERKQ